MKTKKTVIKQKLNIWAIPQGTYTMENDPDAPPFYFEVKTDMCWNTGAVNIHEVEFSAELPEGIDLTAKAIETLKEAKRKVQAEAHRDIADIEKMIDNLIYLEHDDDNGR